MDKWIWDWNRDAALPGLRAVLDPRDELGVKNEIIDRVSRRALRYSLRRCGSRRYSCAVDYGCGIGRLAPDLLKVADRVVGVDQHEAMVERARLEHGGPAVVFALPDALPSITGPLLVTFIYVLSQLSDTEITTVLQRFRKLAEPGANCILIEKSRLPGNDGSSSDDLRSFDWYQNALESAGWRPVGSRPFRYGSSDPLTIAVRVAARAPRAISRPATAMMATTEFALAKVRPGRSYVEHCVWAEAV